MSKPLGIGVVGAGAIGIRGALSHLTQQDVSDRVLVTAVCDPVNGRAAAAAAKFGVPAAHETFEALLADSNVDAVTLCSPIGLHHAQGMQAINAGKHVHFNKTMATTVAHCTEMMEAARKNRVQLVACPGMMLHPFNRRIRKRILAGDIGRVVWAICGAASGTYHFDEEFRTGKDVLTNVDPTWYYRKPGGGPLYDMTVYGLHTMTGILGPARRVTALSGVALRKREFQGRTIDCDMDDSTFILVDFGEVTYAIVYGTVIGSAIKGLSIFGTAGSVVGSQINGEETKLPEDHQPHVNETHKKLPESHVFEDMMQFVDLVRDGTPTVASAEHARHVIDIFESGYRAAETGRAQDLTTSFTPLTAEEC